MISAHDGGCLLGAGVVDGNSGQGSELAVARKLDATSRADAVTPAAARGLLRRTCITPQER
jgi:hypothetical protein